MANTTSADVAAYLGETLTGPLLAQVDALTPVVEAAVNSYCNRKWGVSASQTETFDCGRQIYFPSNSLITAVTSITVDEQTLSSDEYLVYPGYVHLDAPAARGYRTVVITYTANVPLPAEVKQALIQ
jgi:hypothetical protein